MRHSLASTCDIDTIACDMRTTNSRPSHPNWLLRQFLPGKAAGGRAVIAIAHSATARPTRSGAGADAYERLSPGAGRAEGENDETTERPSPSTAPPGLAPAVAVLPMRLALALPRFGRTRTDAVPAADGWARGGRTAAAPAPARPCREQPFLRGEIRGRACGPDRAGRAGRAGGAVTRHPLFARFRAHTPMRPQFRCRACGAPWPCQPARLALLFLYRGDRQGLRVHLAHKMLAALSDQPQQDALTLAARLFGWLPPPGSTRS